jgi:hypothetical protein
MIENIKNNLNIASLMVAKVSFVIVPLFFLASCSKDGSSNSSKSLALLDEEIRPVATWQTVGVVKDAEFNRVYVVNSRSGLVCEHEYFDSGRDKGRRVSNVNCSLPDSFYR